MSWFDFVSENDILTVGSGCIHGCQSAWLRRRSWSLLQVISVVRSGNMERAFVPWLLASAGVSGSDGKGRMASESRILPSACRDEMAAAAAAWFTPTGAEPERPGEGGEYASTP